MLGSYEKLVKIGEFTPKNAKNAEDFDSVGELFAYLEKTGFLLNYKITENRDIVDKTIENMQQYVRRLFNDSQETVTEMYNQKSLAEEAGTIIDDDDLEALYANNGEEHIEIEETLNEEELEQMFRQVENEFK